MYPLLVLDYFRVDACDVRKHRMGARFSAQARKSCRRANRDLNALLPGK